MPPPPAPPVATRPTISASAAAAAAPPAAPVAGLPPDAPKLAISGGVYSNNPAQRMLIVNGLVFNEGSEVGPGVVLEQIRPKGAVLRFRGSRYTVSY
jgi:general secretion pathway protein B